MESILQVSHILQFITWAWGYSKLTKKVWGKSKLYAIIVKTQHICNLIGGNNWAEARNNKKHLCVNAKGNSIFKSSIQYFSQ